MSDDAALARAVLPLVGGAGNLLEVTACWSRLRLVLRDWSLADEPGLGALPGVGMVVTQAGQLQVVLGARAIPVSREVRALIPER
jgi:phosphotransferase system IIB component